MKPSLSRPRSYLAVAVVLIAVAAGCGSGSDDSSAAPTTGAQPAPSGSAANTSNMVNIHNFAFTPDALTVTPGTAVTWTFEDSTDHTVVADDNSFASKAMGNGQTYSHAFVSAGSVAYHCSIHPFMKATVTVK